MVKVLVKNVPFKFQFFHVILLFSGRRPGLSRPPRVVINRLIRNKRPFFTAKHRHRTLDHHQADLFDRRISLRCHVRRADQVRRFCKRAFKIKPLTHKNIQARAANNIVAQCLRQVVLVYDSASGTV